ncbi:C-3 sterol dehydrogenase/C-4 decarboxylase-like protein [Periconia macrospinosa]|uniref:C-3 sterol dehydrogenase/C-4 decarboxylase-like protein n=1 Tax=Periconia macrospinosa TaxID=97972 RepID=A0A2V1DSE6_9PLEO|nr:C-3 sterol dehydrogenase/C-4 decarboxylase-like protein [Periconia macrospinosa]
MAPTKVLITGGTGFLGTAIIQSFLSLPDPSLYTITALDISPPSLGTQSFSQVRYVRSSVLQRDDLKKVFEEARPDVVVHTVGVYPVGQDRYAPYGKKSKRLWDTVFEVNIEGTRNVIDVAKEVGAKALVYTSSVTVLLDELDKDFRNADETWSTGRATTCYGKSKTIAENLVLSANKPDFLTCVLRPSVLFGPNDPVTIPTIHACILAHETPFILGSNTNLQDWTYVSNAADAHVLAVRNLLNSGTAAGEAFFITNGQPVTPRDFCLAIWREFEHTPAFEVRVPEGIAWWVGWGVEWWSWASGAKSVLNRGIVLDATKDRYVSIVKAKKILGYEPKVRLEEACRISCQFFRQKFKAQART